MADISDIYSLAKKPFASPPAGAGSSSAFRLPSRKRFSSAKAVALIGLVVIMLMAIFAFIEVRSGIHSKVRLEPPSSLGDIQTNQKETGVEVLPFLGR